MARPDDTPPAEPGKPIDAPGKPDVHPDGGGTGNPPPPPPPPPPPDHQ